jgi:hypothetical protein
MPEISEEATNQDQAKRKQNDAWRTYLKKNPRQTITLSSATSIGMLDDDWKKEETTVAVNPASKPLAGEHPQVKKSKVAVLSMDHGSFIATITTKEETVFGPVVDSGHF